MLIFFLVVSYTGVVGAIAWAIVGGLIIPWLGKEEPEEKRQERLRKKEERRIKRAERIRKYHAFDNAMMWVWFFVSLAIIAYAFFTGKWF